MWPDVDHGLWWGSEADGRLGGQRWETLVPYVRNLRMSQGVRHERNLRHAILYDPNGGLDGITEGWWQWDLRTSPLADIVVENIIQTIVQTLTAQVGKDRPRAAFMTDGGDWKTQRLAKKLERAVEAEWERTRVYDLGRQIFRDGGVLGTGVLKNSLVNGRWHPARVLIDDMTVDEADARMGYPSHIYEVMFIDRHIAAKRYPKQAEAILRAPPAIDQWMTMRYLNRNHVAFIEAFHLPTDEDAPEGETDGRHTICFDGGQVLDDPYTAPWFPYVFLHNEERVTGFQGRGVAERQASRQLRINKVNQIIILCQDRFAFPHVFLHYADAQLKAKLIPIIGRIVLWSLQRPTVETPAAVSKELYDYRQQLKEDAYFEEGLSDQALIGQVNRGLETGKAVREAYDVNRVRHGPLAQKLETFYMETARQTVWFLAEAAKERPVKARWNGPRATQQVEWSRTDSEDFAGAVRIRAASTAARTPAAQYDEADHYVSKGWISPEQGMKLMNHPDLDRILDLQSSDEDDAEATIDMLSSPRIPFDGPRPEQKLDLVLERVRRAYNNAYNAKAPDAVLERFITWMDLAKIKMLSAMAAGAPGPAGPPPEAAPPLGAPLPPSPTAAQAGPPPPPMAA